ncbi:MAG: WGR domain-containing protein [Gammaproteobacteria bacterium]|nr:WGR domain-containing protein [Gammaproteobacteria bacterium]
MLDPVLRFQTRTPGVARYYLIATGTDLFGAPVLWRAWGGQGSRRGGARLQHLPDQATLAAALELQLRRRARHGYRIAPVG